jgi:hypothetical protein
VKTVLAGAGIAAAAGLLMGGAARPQLSIDDRPEGPQILAGWTGARSTGPFDDGGTFAAYNGKIPDYVLGTDWKRSLSPPPIPPEPLERPARNDEPPPAEDFDDTHAAYDAPPAAAPVYPSLQGGADLAATDQEPGEPGVTG